MKHDVVDAFVSPLGGGNPAGVVLCHEEFYSEQEMLAKAAELGFSETVFLLPNNEGWHFRYFTPVEEAPLCGHATIAAVHWLGEQGKIKNGSEIRIRTGAGKLGINLGEDGVIWMEMATPKLLRSFSQEETKEVYDPFGDHELRDETQPVPESVSTGLPDIILPIRSREALDSLQPNMEAISECSKKWRVGGYHLYAPGEGQITAFTRNFAPLLGIPEEAATGTASGALAYFLFRQSLVTSGQVLCFRQGEAMGLPSNIYARVEAKDGTISIEVGGRAKIRS